MAVLLLATGRLDAQVKNDKLKKPITITSAGIRVDSFLNIVSRQTGLGFSFNSKKISPTKHISIKKGTYTMGQCLAEIQKVTGIHYAVKNDHIILVDNPPQEKYRLHLGVAVKKPAVVVKKPVVVETKRVVASKHMFNTKPRDTVVLVKDAVATIKDTMVVVKDSVPAIIKDSLPGIAVAAAPKPRGLPSLFPKDTTKLRSDSTKPKPIKPVVNRRDRSTYRPGRSRPASSVNDQRYDESAGSFHAGIVAVRPDIYNMVGIGITLLYEEPVGNDNWSLTASAGYHIALGDYTKQIWTYDTFVNPDSVLRDTTLKNFAQIPVLVGLRWYVARPLYASLEAGYTIKASKDMASFFSVAPSLGLKLPVGKKAIDINVKYLYMMGPPTIPEKSRLEKGDYGLWSLRVAYAF